MFVSFKFLQTLISQGPTHFLTSVWGSCLMVWEKTPSMVYITSNVKEMGWPSQLRGDLTLSLPHCWEMKLGWEETTSRWRDHELAGERVLPEPVGQGLENLGCVTRNHPMLTKEELAFSSIKNSSFPRPWDPQRDSTVESEMLSKCETGDRQVTFSSPRALDTGASCKKREL